jgi:Na+/melibiose symporter-like transporter
MLFSLLRNLPLKEKRTFSLHLVFSVIDGMIRGALLLNEYVFIKSLSGSSYQLSFLFQSSLIVLLLSVFFNELIFRAKRKGRMLRMAGLITHLPLLLLLFFPRNPEIYSQQAVYHYVFLFVFFTYYLSYPIVLPTINLFLKNSYSKDNFGRLYSLGTTVRQIMMMLIIFFFGLLLDKDNFAFTYIFPVLGILGIISIVLISIIEYNPLSVPVKTESLLMSVFSSFKKMITILKTNRPFLDFQIAYLFYGFTFNSTRSVINIFYNDALKLNYTSVAFYQNAYNIIAILLIRFFGKLIGKMDARKFTMYSFAFMAGYILFIGLTSYVPYYVDISTLRIYITLLIATIFFGLFNATIILSWNIGSAYFCTNEEAGDYQSVHLFLTGFRGIYSPILGVIFYEILGFSWTFGIGVFMLFLAVWIMQWSYKRRSFKLKVIS